MWDYWLEQRQTETKRSLRLRRLPKRQVNASSSNYLPIHFFYPVDEWKKETHKQLRYPYLCRSSSDAVGSIFTEFVLVCGTRLALAPKEGVIDWTRWQEMAKLEGKAGTTLVRLEHKRRRSTSLSCPIERHNKQKSRSFFILVVN